MFGGNGEVVGLFGGSGVVFFGGEEEILNDKVVL